jgi:hypothetical protein
VVRSGDAEETPCGSQAREAGNTGGTRACIPNGKRSGFTTPTSRAVGAVQSALDRMWAGAVAKYLFSPCAPLQFAKAGSAATLAQQERNNSADVPRSRVNITGFVCAVAS